MKVKRILHKAFYLFGALFLSLLFVFQTAIIPAKADENAVVYTDVLEDLQKDETFDVEQYPAVADDYSLQVIQIAESVNNELFVYVYQPSDTLVDVVASHISMYNGYSENGKDFSPRLYDLTLLNSNGVFDKYLVNDYVVSSEMERWYNIVSIYRFPIDGIDTNIANGTTDKLGYSVGQQWRFYYFNDVLNVEMGTFKTLSIDIVTADNVIYNNGLTIGNLAGLYKRASSHFVCFNVEEYIIEHIYDADVTFLSRPVTTYSGIGVPDDSYGEWERQTVTLYDNDTATFNGSGFLGKTYTWNRISRSEDFVSNLENQNVKFNEASRNAILSSQWTFAFCETERDLSSVSGWTISSFTEVAEVTILRLHFVDVTGNYYNLGTVANIVTEDDVPAGEGDPVEDAIEELLAKFDSWLKIIGIAIACIAVGVVLVFLVSILWPVLWPLIVAVGKGLVKWIAKGIAFVFKAIWVIITLPFVLIGKLFGRKDKPDFINDKEHYHEE